MSSSLLTNRKPLCGQAQRQQQWHQLIAFGVLCVLAIVIFLGGIAWGLPSRDTDRFLFGLRAPWSGKEVQQLTGSRSTVTNQAVDVDRNPLDRNGSVILNRALTDRAEIVRRYRLFTYQPDEMVTMMALAQMRPSERDFDPRLYQYGGLWIYPVGAMLRVAGALHLIQLTPDEAFYLDHPEAFGRFYVTARLYVVVWSLLGAWVVFSLVQTWTRGSLSAACVACFCYLMLPVVVNMSHEAKPHLPGAVLTLLTIMAASKYVRTAELRWFVVAAVAAGLAVGMVLNAWPALVVLPVATLLVRQDWRLRCRLAAMSIGLAITVYFVVNPYVFVHLFNNRELLRSSLGNTREMFQFSIGMRAISNAVMLIAEGATAHIAIIGAGAMIGFAVIAWRFSVVRQHPIWLLLVPAICSLLQFVMFAKNQPAAYARFAIFFDLALLMAAVVGSLELLCRMKWRPELLVLLALTAALSGSRYYAAFVADVATVTSREQAAQVLEGYWSAGSRRVGVMAEPAPYSVPPLNLFNWQLILLPKDYDPSRDPHRPDVIV